MLHLLETLIFITKVLTASSLIQILQKRKCFVVIINNAHEL